MIQWLLSDLYVFVRSTIVLTKKIRWKHFVNKYTFFENIKKQNVNKKNELLTLILIFLEKKYHEKFHIFHKKKNINKIKTNFHLLLSFENKTLLSQSFD